MTYEEALNYLNAPIYSAVRPGLEPMRELMQLLGNPQNELKYVHVTGTNGKGSTSSYLASILRAAGYKTGLYTSPYLIHFTERIQINGQEISKEDLARLTTQVKAAVNKICQLGHQVPTIFEMVTAVAFLYYKEQMCDIVVLEVGMGGRLDATNLIPASEVSVITALDLDHIDYLGNTLAEITWEKAGIIKSNGKVVCYPQKPEAEYVIKRVSEEKEAELTIVNLDEIVRLHSDVHGQVFRMGMEQKFIIHMLGEYQVNNAAVAITAAKKMSENGWHITDSVIEKGLKQTRWPGRFELVHQNPLMIADGAHNPNGVEALANGLRALFLDEKITFIVGVLADKDYTSMFQIIKPLAKRFLTVTPHSERALPAEELSRKLQADGFETENYSSVSEAIDAAFQKYPNDIICAFGSLYYIGDVCAYCRKFDEKVKRETPS